MNKERKVECGFNKWSMGTKISEEGWLCVKISMCHYPVENNILLWDATPKQLRELSEMFLMTAIDLEKLEKEEKKDEAVEG